VPKIPGGGRFQLGMATFLHAKNGRFIEKEKKWEKSCRQYISMVRGCDMEKLAKISKM
jgi:phosphoserine phosphatase